MFLFCYVLTPTLELSQVRKFRMIIVDPHRRRTVVISRTRHVLETERSCVRPMRIVRAKRSRVMMVSVDEHVRSVVFERGVRAWYSSVAFERGIRAWHSSVAFEREAREYHFHRSLTRSTHEFEDKYFNRTPILYLNTDANCITCSWNIT